MTSKFHGGLALKAAILFVAFLQCSCSDFFQPVESTPTPSEYEFNYWLLKRQYLYEDELEKLDPHGDSVQTLYSALSDRYTRYIPPSKSEEVSTSIESSFISGDVGMEYKWGDTEHPLYIHRVYPNSPAGRAGVPRHGNIIKINDVKLEGCTAYSVYDSVLSKNKEVSLTVVSQQDTLHFDLIKEDVYAPTVILDTLYGTEFIIITEFKQITAGKNPNGTYGELQSLLDTLPNDGKPRILDLRGNPGGLVNQCIKMADLFVKSGKLSTRAWRALEPDGQAVKRTITENAKPGDAGEGRPFMLLVDKSSASCAEIFTAAVAEGADIPVAGSASYGKGIGQSTWNTINNGLAIITNLEFLTPKGNSYHKTGIVPDYPCEYETITTKCRTSVAISSKCAVDALHKAYGKKSLEKITPHIQENLQPIYRQQKSLGGALLNL